MNAIAALNNYKKVDLECRIEAASPHELVSMLFAGAMNEMSRARLCMGKGDYFGKGASISKSIAIIQELAISLDMERGGDVAVKLGDLYDYMARRLMDANIKNDAEIVGEVMGLMRPISDAWSQIPLVVNKNNKP